MASEIFTYDYTINSIPSGCRCSCNRVTGNVSFPFTCNTVTNSNFYIYDANNLNVSGKCFIKITSGSPDNFMQARIERDDNGKIITELSNTNNYLVIPQESTANAAFTADIVFLDDSNSIGNIPMGELTFNGVQSVTYNGTDYTKLVVDGTSYPPPPPPVTIISFTVKHESGTVTRYQAEEGMTWAEWINSSYNTDNYIIDTEGFVKVNKRGACIDKGNHGGVISSENIIKDYTYVTTTAIK